MLVIGITVGVVALVVVAVIAVVLIYQKQPRSNVVRRRKYAVESHELM